MSFDIAEFEKIISSFYDKLKSVEISKTSIKPGEDKWALKEIVGHLVDSASNNRQRFIRLQLEDNLVLSGYHPETWVNIQKYNTYEWNDLIEFWRLYNEMILHIIKNIDKTKLGNVWDTGDKKITLEFLVNDYFDHMKNHIKHFEERYLEIANNR